MSNATSSISPIASTVNALRIQLMPCPKEHAFFKRQAISTVVGSVVASGELADVDCTGEYIRAMRNGSGFVENAMVSRLTDSGAFEQVFIPGAPHLGRFVKFGLSVQRIIVTIDCATAALIHTSTDETVVAALYAENLGAVCEEILHYRPGTEIIVAVDYKPGDLSHDSRVIRHAMAVASQYSLKLAYSGVASSFMELQRHSGSEGIATQIEFAAVPVTDVDQANIPSSHVALAIPASTAQNGSSLMFDLVAAVLRSVIVSPESALLIALWIVFTHVYQRFPIAPLLAITSPEKRCGKTNMLTLLARLCRTAFAASNLSEAAIYRCIEQDKPTLLLDEADTYLVNNRAMIGILNSGYKLTTGFVVRSSGKAAIVKMSTFCPKAIAMIGEMPETLKDRSLHIRLERKSPDEKVEAVSEQGPDELTLLFSRLLRWANDNGSALAHVKPENLGLNNDRAEDNARPLLAIASLMGGNWLERAQSAIAAHADTGDKALSHGEWLLTDTARAFAQQGVSQLLTADLLAFLHAQEEAPWLTFSRGRAMTPRDLSGMFKQYRIASTQIRHGINQVGRGYRREQFTKAFASYVKATAAL
jgi:putative DNA primase/helicase